MKTLFDNHHRPLNYLRLAVTDRCNLRCFYCMPAEGIEYLPKKELLSYEEMLRLVRIMGSMGITKIRITGGEPFVRTDLMKFLHEMVEVPGIAEWHVTTNGVLTAPHIPALKKLGVASVNLSLDTLDRDRFRLITRRDEFGACLSTLDELMRHEIPVKINTVVMPGKNIEDIIPIANLAKEKNISVRFIEEMPFNGSGRVAEYWSYRKIVDYLKEHFPNLSRISDPANSTAYHYKIPGHAGTIGVIAGFSRTFCGTCNRIRLTSQGVLKTCLYDDGVLDVKKLLRAGMTDADIELTLLNAFQSRALNGIEAEKRNASRNSRESMSTIGG